MASENIFPATGADKGMTPRRSVGNMLVFTAGDPKASKRVGKLMIDKYGSLAIDSATATARAKLADASDVAE